MDFQTLNTVLSVFAFVLGSMVGSFLNVCIYRIPRGESIVRPRSHCPKCGNGIAWYDNFPIISWLVLGAKCRHCGEVISWQYPLVEGITGALFFLVFWRFGLVVATPIYMAVSAGLVLATFVDLTDWTIPDEVTLPGIPIAILCSLVAMYVPESGLRMQGPFVPVFNALLGVEVGGGILFIIDKLTRLLLRKRGMGFGDVKLLAMLGGFFGLVGVFEIVVIASILGSLLGVLMLLVTKKQQGGEGGKAEEVTMGGFLGMPGTILVTMTAEFVGMIARGLSKKEAAEPAEGEEEEQLTLVGHYIPFGPYLCAAGLIVMFFGPEIIDAYLAFLNRGL